MFFGDADGGGPWLARMRGVGARDRTAGSTLAGWRFGMRLARLAADAASADAAGAAGWRNRMRRRAGGRDGAGPADLRWVVVWGVWVGGAGIGRVPACQSSSIRSSRVKRRFRQAIINSIMER